MKLQDTNSSIIVSRCAVLRIRCNLLARPTRKRAFLLTLFTQEATDTLRLWDRCRQLTKQLPCCWDVKEILNTKLSRGRSAESRTAGPERAAGHTDGSSIDCFNAAPEFHMGLSSTMTL